MAGPSGAGAVKHYLAGMRDVLSNGSRRQYLAALHRAGIRANQSRLVGFECLSLCVTCGYLLEPRTSDPMRTDAKHPGVCPACRSSGMLDLRNDAMVEQLAELEAREPVSRRPIIRVLAWVGATAVAGLAIYLGLQFGHQDELGGVWIFGLPLVLMAGAVWVDRASTRASVDRSTPRRWRLAALPEDPDSLRDEVAGAASSSVELLRAPLSGRPCIAYEVAVGGPATDDRLSTWRLVEQRNVACRVGELAVGDDQLVLQLPRESWLSGTPTGDANLSRFLRMRGLFDHDPVEIFETILVPGQVCRVGRSSKHTLHAYE